MLNPTVAPIEPVRTFWGANSSSKQQTREVFPRFQSQPFVSHPVGFVIAEQGFYDRVKPWFAFETLRNKQDQFVTRVQVFEVKLWVEAGNDREETALPIEAQGAVGATNTAIVADGRKALPWSHGGDNLFQRHSPTRAGQKGQQQ